MPKTNKSLQNLLSTSGYVSTEEACKLIGRSISGSTVGALRKAGVSCVQLGSGSTSPLMWKKDELNRVPVNRLTPAGKKKTATPSTLSPVETLLLQRVESLEQRLESLETRIAVTESVLEDRFPGSLKGGDVLPVAKGLLS